MNFSLLLYESRLTNKCLDNLSTPSPSSLRVFTYYTFHIHFDGTLSLPSLYKYVYVFYSTALLVFLHSIPTFKGVVYENPVFDEHEHTY